LTHLVEVADSLVEQFYIAGIPPEKHAEANQPHNHGTSRVEIFLPHKQVNHYCRR